MEPNEYLTPFLPSTFEEFVEMKETERQGEDSPQVKLDRISFLERKGEKQILSSREICELDQLYAELFGRHLSKEQRKVYGQIDNCEKER